MHLLGIDPAKERGDYSGPLEEPNQASLVVIDDANLGFRQHPESWPAALTTGPGDPWVVLKLAYPAANGDFLKFLSARHAERLVVVVTANDLRLSGAQISRGLSWERIAQDTRWELSYNPELKDLARACWVVVSFAHNGAVVINQDRDPGCTLFFDPYHIDDGASLTDTGSMVGYNTCMTAAIVRKLLQDDQLTFESLAQGVLSGLSAARDLFERGYQHCGSHYYDTRIEFPYQRITAEIDKPSHRFGQSVIRDPLVSLSVPGDRFAEQFSILSQQCCENMQELAFEIVTKGPEKAITNIPVGKFGKLFTVDRSEIESYRTVAALIQEYVLQEKTDKPLSIAVFGAPGSGKSFGIKEIANSISSKVKEITFNISQMNSPADLIGAFHQVRDEGLRGKIPLVFWDEFDSALNGQALGWLRYFLSPMQDGSFLEGQVTHPIGRAIFVFAGGTCEQMADFGKQLAGDRNESDKLFQALKGPDFKSRLKGFINILGPNKSKTASDPHYLIRRAILLHSILRRLAPQIFHPHLHIDPNLVDAFLETKIYLHGVRSMESIVSMSQLAGKTCFERSCLPPISQLNLHVLGWDFMARVQKLTFEGDALDVLARAVHEDYCEYMLSEGLHFRDGSAPAPDRDSFRLPYYDLPLHEKEQNIRNAVDIPNKLAQAGYVMVHARANEPPLIFPDSDLEPLAEAEHVRWVKAKVASDPRWRYAPETDKQQFHHSGLLSWRKMSSAELALIFSQEERAALGEGVLPDSEKEKDRLMIRRIPHILSRVGYTVVKLKGED
jgi:hypothetical protein